jgi:predicted nucleotidyltransferase
MSDMNLFAKKQHQLGELCRQNHITRLAMFGSMARREATAGSDVDLLVEFEPGHAPSLARMHQLRLAFAALLEVQQVDLATRSILRNPYRRKAILADLQEVYAA